MSSLRVDEILSPFRRTHTIQYTIDGTSAPTILRIYYYFYFRRLISIAPMTFYQLICLIKYAAATTKRHCTALDCAAAADMSNGDDDNSSLASGHSTQLHCISIETLLCIVCCPSGHNNTYYLWTYARTTDYLDRLSIAFCFFHLTTQRSEPFCQSFIHSLTPSIVYFTAPAWRLSMRNCLDTFLINIELYWLMLAQPLHWWCCVNELVGCLNCILERIRVFMRGLV